MEAFVFFNLHIIPDIYEAYTKEEHQMFRALVNRRVFATGLLSVDETHSSVECTFQQSIKSREN